MVNFREVNDDILKEWLLYREDEITSLSCEKERKHWGYFDEISDKILNSIPKQNRDFVRRQLNSLDDNFLDYIGYWNEKYYRNGVADGSQLVMGVFLGIEKLRRISPQFKFRHYPFLIHHTLIKYQFLVF